MSESIQVAVRVRPLGAKDADAKSQLSTAGKVVSIQHLDQAFSYTEVYGTRSTQEEVFDKSVMPLLPSLFKGFNLTILAYGQTGSGKTYTMGTAGGNDNGIITKSIAHIFRQASSDPDCEFNVSVSFLELYLEDLRDLLASATSSSGTANLDIREDCNGNIVVPGLTELAVSSTDEALSWLAQGSAFRKTGATAMNLVSSRSHAVFTIKVECKYIDGRPATVSKFSLVDLAGSERAKKTGSSGERMLEGIDINKGLLALGNVISALSEQKKGRHIPYRDSKLTRLLQDSLGGNSQTLMIACVSPSSKNLQETLSTLRYATRALKIKNKPVVNMDMRAAEINELQNQVQALHALLEQEKLVKARQLCPPGHQRLITLVKQSLEDSGEGGAIAEKIKNSSPMTRDHLRHIGILFDGNDTDSDTYHSLSATGFYSENAPSPPENISNAETEQGYEEHQAQLNTELRDLETEIETKEAEMNGLADISLVEYEEKCQNLLQQVEDLQHQKVLLEKQLSELQCSQSKASAMLAEQRRQQIKELERKIMLQKRELAEIAKLRHEKKRDTEKIVILGKDIQNLKAAKIKLSKEIKKSAENFRSWKHNQEREVGKLKEAAARGKYQLDKITRQHVRQHNVMQRRYEEAMASNKRLQATINNQRFNEKMSTTHKSFMQSNPDKLNKWLSSEIEIQKSKAIHRDAIDHLIAEKDRLQKKKKNLQNMKCWEDPATKRKRLKEIAIVDSEIGIQSKRINELEKIVSSEGGESSKNHGSRWTYISNLSDARLVMENLMQSYIQTDRDLAATKERLAETEDSLVTENKKLREQLMLLQSQKSPQQKPELEPQPPVCENNSTPVSTPIQIDPSKTFNLQSMHKNKRKTLFFKNDFDDDSEEEVIQDDIDKDPDWRQTPFHKQLRTKISNNATEIGPEEVQLKKTSLDNRKCKCTGKCDTNRCGCRKSDEQCSENCICNAGQCRNRFSQPEDEESQEMLNSTPLNTTFEVTKRKSSDIHEVPKEECPPEKRKRRMFSSVKIEFNL